MSLMAHSPAQHMLTPAFRLPVSPAGPAGERTDWAGVASVAAGAATWGVGAGVAGFIFAVSTMSAATVTFWRFLAAGIILALAYEARRVFSPARHCGAPSLLAIMHRHGFALIIIGSALAAAQSLMYASVASLGAGLGTIVPLAVSPVAMAVLSMPLLRTRLNLAGWLTMIPPLVAMACVVGLTNGATAAEVSVIGVCLAVTAAAAHALMTISSKRLSTGGTSVCGTTTLTFLIASVALAPFAAANGFLGHTDRPWAVIGCLVVLAVFASVVAYPLFFAGVKRIAAPVAAIVMLVQLIVATLMGTIVLGEPMPAAAWLALAALIAGIIIHTLAARSLPMGRNRERVAIG